MNKLEQLEQEAFVDKIQVHDFYLGEENLKGFYMDRNIAINTSVDNYAERTCVLAEELGHHYTSVGDLLNQRISENRKQEFQARMYAYNKLIGLQGIIDCYEYGCKNTYEMSEYLEVTEKFIIDALDAYKRKYGLQTKYKDYIVRFDPSLIVMEII